MQREGRISRGYSEIANFVCSRRNATRTKRWRGCGLRAHLGHERRHRARLHQRGAYRIANEIMQQRRLPEAHLGLRRMHVDVNFGERHLEKQQYNGIDRRRNDVAVSLGERVLHQAITNQPAIDKDEDGIAIELLDFGPRNKTMQLEVALHRLGFDLRQVAGRRHGGGCGRPMRSSGSIALSGNNWSSVSRPNT